MKLSGLLRVVSLVVCAASLVRLPAAVGDLDPGYNPNATIGTFATATALQPDGKLVVGGAFTSFGSTSRNYLARLNANGSVDTAFDPNPDGAVQAIVVLPDGKIIVGGSFTTIAGSPRSRIARLNADGSIDPTYDPGANSTVRRFLLQPDGRLLVAGVFSTLGGSARSQLGRLEPNGSLDPNFNPNVTGGISSLGLQTDGKIVLVGGFSLTVGGVARNGFARINADGSLDSLVASLNGVAESTLVLPDDRILIGGNNFNTVAGVARERIARLKADGSLDTGFNPGAFGGGVFALSLQTDGQLLVGGAFSSFGGNPRNRAARLKADATLDSAFNPNADEAVYALALDDQGRVVLAGGYAQIGSTFRSRFARVALEAASQALTAPSPSSVEWLRGGSSPETYHVTFERSTDGGATWTLLGTGTRISGGWTLGGLTLSGTFHLRARARVLSGQANGSSGIVEKIEVITFPAPEIEVSGGATPGVVIASGDTSPVTTDGTHFGTVPVAGTAQAQQTYTIRNIGTASLQVTSVLATPGSDFVVGNFTPGLIAPTATTTFTVTFDPTAGGPRTSTITIANNDSDEASHTFLVEGNGLGFPEIDVLGPPLVSIPNNTFVHVPGQGRDLGTVLLTAGPGPQHVFTIRNDGHATLNVTGITSSNPSEFIPSGFTPGPIAPGGFTTFIVRFDPSVLHLRTSDITIANDDADEAPYMFRLQGNGGAPEITISGKSVIIPDGTTTTTGNDDTDFASRSVCAPGSTSHTFTIRNTGNLPLTITAIGKSGLHPGDFLTPPLTPPATLPATINPNATFDFVVNFDPTAGGARSAVIEVTHDAPGGPIYNFAVSGQGTGPEIQLEGGTPPLVIPHNSLHPVVGDHAHFGDVAAAGNVTLTRTFTLRNLGDANLTITSINSFTTPEFLIQAPTMPAVILPQGTLTFDIAFDPAQVGARASDIWIVNDDCDESSYTFVVKGNGIGFPEIDVQGPPQISIPHNTLTPVAGQGTDFGPFSISAGATPPRTFKIHNTGDSDLTITSIISTNSAEFTPGPITPPLPATISPGGQFPFQVSFNPNGTGTRLSTIEIANNDANEAPYKFAVTGEGVAVPDIIVRAGPNAQVIAHGDFDPEAGDLTDWGTQLVSGGWVGPHVISIYNQGAADLDVTSITSSAPNEFIVIAPSLTLPAMLVPFQGMYFTAYFYPQGPGPRAATITVNSTDPDTPAYSFGVKGNGLAFPDIELRGAYNKLILDGDTVPDTGPANDGTTLPATQLSAGSSAASTFKIHNLGDGPLTITSIQSTIAGTQSPSSEFIPANITPALNVPIAPGGNKTFTVAFNPTQTGLRSADITIHNDDADEPAYRFRVQGQGLPDGNADVLVRGNNNPVPHQSMSTGTGNWTEFGGTLWTDNSTLDRVFTVTNTGTGAATLTLGAAFLTGTNPGDFQIFTQPSTNPLLPTASTTFTVRFNPSAAGPRSAIVKLPTNITGKNPYEFRISGNGNAWTQVAADMTVRGNNVVIPDGSGPPTTANHTHFGSTAVSGGVVTRTFTIRNTGQTALALNGMPLRVQKSGLHASDFTVTQPTVSSLGTNVSATFSVIFNPSSWGTRTAMLSIPNSDTPKNPYNFAISGYGTPSIFVGGGSGFSWGGMGPRWTPIGGGSLEGGIDPTPRSAVGPPQPFAWGANASGQLARAAVAGLDAPASVPLGGALAGKQVITVAAGGAHSVALCADGTVAAWGQGTAGQLGHGAFTDSATPVAVTSSGALAGKTVVALAAGATHTLALCADGTVVAWGAGAAGQLGHGATTGSAVPVVVSAAGVLAGKTVIAIAAGAEHSAALCADGTVATWGSNAFGQLGDGTTTARSTPALAGTAAASGLAGKTIVALATGASHTLVATADGIVAAWGRNHAGQLGDGTTTNRSAPVLVAASGPLGGRTVVFIAAGAAHSLALCSDDTIVAWGDNAEGQLGNGLSVGSNVPVPVERTGALADRTPIALAAGAQHSLVLFADGEFAGWGSNAQGQLGVAGTAPQRMPVSAQAGTIVAGSRLLALATGPAANHTLALVGAPAPELVVRGAGLVILDGTPQASLADGSDFGAAAVGAGTVTRTFTVTNAGGAALALPGTPRLAVGGAHAADFTVAVSPPATLAPGATAAFALTFAPTAAGLRTATVTLASDDPAAPQFTFAIQGNGSAPGAVAAGSNLGANNAVLAAAVQPDGGALLGGNFTAFGPATPQRIARLLPDGTLDLAFDVAADNSVAAAFVQADGAVVLGGSFTTVGGAARANIARVTAAGVVDAGFNPGADDAIMAFAGQPDGRLLVAGRFTTLGGAARSRIARLNADGTLDSGFNPGANRAVYTVAVQTDGKIILAGNFDVVAGLSRNRIARLNPDGTVDTTFNPGPNSDVTSVAVQADGRIVIGGQFTSVAGTPRNRVARLQADGSLDATFDPNVDSAVYTLAVQTDGKILLGGAFNTVGGVARTRIARLNADGTPDTTLVATANDVVFGTTLHADGTVLLTGYFTAVNDSTRTYVTRLDNSGATSSLALTSASRVQWLRGGSSPETLQVTFERSLDGGATWTALGAGTRIAGGWELTGQTFTGTGLVRARARTTGGAYTGSSGLVEAVTTFDFASAPQIVTPPLAQAGVVGGNATFSVVAAGNPAPTFQWGRASAMGLTQIAGATGPTLTLTNLQAGDVGSYAVTVTNASGSVTSTPVALTVATVPVAPFITRHPLPRTVNAGEIAGFTVAAEGAGPLGFQWRKGGTPIEGATAASFTIQSTSAANAGSYDVVVTNSVGSATSNPATLTINVAPSIVTAPVSRVAAAGTGVVFSVTAAGTAPLTYRWTRNGEPVANGTGATLSLANVGPDVAGSYRVTVSNAGGTVTSDPVTLTVLAVQATHAAVGPGYLAGGTLTIRNTFAFAAGTSSLGWQVLLPAGWSFVAGGGQQGDVRPQAGTTALLEWAWTAIPASPLSFTYTLNVPAGTTGPQALAALALVRQDGVAGQLVALPDPLVVNAIGHHSADTDRDYRFGLFELTRVIALYNVRNGTVRTGAYAVAAGTEDGFAPAPTRAVGSVVALTQHHAADTDRDGRIGLLELTRVIELFNTYSGTTRTGAYRPQPGTEDGYAAGP